MKSVVIIDHTPYIVRARLKEIARLAKLGKRARQKIGTPTYSDRCYRVYPRKGKEEELRRLIYFFISRPYYSVGMKAYVTIPKDVNDEFWNDLINWYHPGGKATLITCIQEFRDMEYRYTEFWEALGACHTVSNSFRCLLYRRGVAGRGTIRPNAESKWETFSDSPEFGCEGHADFRIGRVVIDWTARQFGFKQFPRIYLDRRQAAPTCNLP